VRPSASLSWRSANVAGAMTQARSGSKQQNKAVEDDLGGSGKGVRRTLVEQQILDRAADLFAERGVAGTTLQDVADALGMSRPALYYYVRSKEAILGRLVENLSGQDARALDAIRRRRRGTPAEKLHEMAYVVALNASSNPKQSRILVENKHQLPPDLAEADRTAERSILRSIQTMIEQGVLAGEFRPVDAHTAALSIIGMCVWTAWWVGPDQRPEELADQIAEQAVAGVTASGRRGGDRSDPATVLRGLREDLDQLERLL
jgi:AcrR family transcriptional regulator